MLLIKPTALTVGFPESELHQKSSGSRDSRLALCRRSYDPVNFHSNFENQPTQNYPRLKNKKQTKNKTTNKQKKKQQQQRQQNPPKTTQKQKGNISSFSLK